MCEFIQYTVLSINFIFWQKTWKWHFKENKPASEQTMQ